MTASTARSWWLLLAWLVASFTCVAHAQAPLALEQLRDSTNLADRLALLRDPSGALTLQDVRVKYDAFVPHDGSPLSFGLSDDALWLRFATRNGGNQAVRWLLEVGEPTLQHVQLHVVHRDGRVESYQGGTALPFASRAIRHPNLVFELLSAADDEAVIYVRARSIMLRTPLRAWSVAGYAAHHEYDTFLRAMALGAMLLVALYHLGLLSLVRQIENAWYGLVSLALASVTMCLNGQLGQLLLPHSPELVMRAVPLTIALGMVTVAFFTYSATEQLKTQLPLTDLLWKVALSTLGVLALALFAPIGFTLRVELGILLLICLAGPYLLYAVRGLPIPEMGRYTVGWYTLIISIPIAILRYAGVWPEDVLSEWVLPIGFVAYGVSNSLALAAMASRLRSEVGAMNLKLIANVSELEQALQRAEEASDAARRATKAKDEFVATMSHELRTPLNAIINIPQGLIGEFESQRSARCSHCQTSYLLDDEDRIDAQTQCEDCDQVGTLVEGTKVKFRGDDARCLRFLQKIERSGQHLLQMVNGVLDYSKLEAGRFELVLGAVEVDALIREVHEQMIDLAQRKNIQLELVAPASSEGTLMGDVLRLKQVLINLLANAIKFSEPGTTVTVRWTTSAELVLIEVQDRGIGIAPADHERVFTSFEQVHKGDTRKYGGTGLGLSISRSLVRMHGGELSVRSELGQGATFVVRLPRLPVANSPSSETYVQAENSGVVAHEPRAALEQLP